MGIRAVFRSILGGRVTRRLDIDSGSRRAVNQRGADYSLAYVACELAKSRPISSLPVHVYERDDIGRRVAQERGAAALQRLLSRSWNPLVKAGEGIRWALMTRDTLGAAYVRVEWSNGVPVALWPVTASVVPEFDDVSRTAMFRVDGGDQFTPAGNYLPSEVVVIKSPLPDGGAVHGRSLAEMAAANVGLSIDLEEFYTRLLTNGDHFPGYLETDQDLTDKDKVEIAESMADHAGIISAGTLRIFDKGLRYKTSPLTMGDISLIDQQTWVLEQMCRVLSVPPQEVYDLSHATYSNVEQGAIQFAQKTLVPECRDLETSFDCVLDAMGLDGCHVKFDLNGLMRGTYAERMDGYRTGIYAGFFTRNEVRGWEELPKLEGLDEPLQPTAYLGIDENGNPTQALQPIHADMTRRVRARFADKGDTEQTREFAAKVLKPYALACVAGGVDYDMQSEIEELSHE